MQQIKTRIKNDKDYEVKKRAWEEHFVKDAEKPKIVKDYKEYPSNKFLDRKDKDTKS